MTSVEGYAETMGICEDSNPIFVSILVSFCVSVIGMTWVLWEKEPIATAPEPGDAIEIPSMWYTFQTNAHTLLQSPLPLWHNQDILHCMVSWMKQVNHVNYEDLTTVLCVLQTDLKSLHRWEAEKWLTIACRLWAVDPTCEMVAWIVQPKKTSPTTPRSFLDHPR
jgi:hypothetical protein